MLHMDNCSSPTSETTQGFMAKKGIKMIKHPLYSPNLAQGDFLYFPKLKNLLGRVQIEDSSVRKTLEQVGHTMSKEDYMEKYHKWVQHWNSAWRSAGAMWIKNIIGEINFN